MGAMYDFTCTGCGHIARDLNGSRDRGFVAIVETRRCTDCGHLADYQVDSITDGGSGEQVELCDPAPPCERCGGPTKPWTRNCPHCGRYMKQGEVTALWD